MQAEMLPNIYMTATNPYYFPVVIVPVVMLGLRLSTEVCNSTRPVNTLDYPPAANNSSTKDMLPLYLQDWKCIQHMHSYHN